MERKESADPSRAIIEGRARALAATCGVSFEFFWVDMNWRALVVIVCQNCGQPFAHERDVRIVHMLPPLDPTDWARQHARNVVLLCTECDNRRQGSRDYASWLDDEAAALGPVSVN